MESGKIPIIVGNWKMYKTIEQATSFVQEIAPNIAQASTRVLLAVPFTAIQPLHEAAKDTKIEIGAQNMNDALEGAFTGEVAASMLHDAGATFVILGHSERRKIFAETNAFINRKVKRALDAQLEPIVCIGESFEDRESGNTEKILKQQLEECLAGIDPGSIRSLMVAYEPIWAIGTGKAATSQIANETQGFCREVLTSLFGEDTQARISILYGGSVTEKNVGEFLSQKNINGVLVGSASLYPDSFAKIIMFRQNSVKSTSTEE